MRDCSLGAQKITNVTVKIIHLDHHILPDLVLHADIKAERMGSLEGSVNVVGKKLRRNNDIS